MSGSSASVNSSAELWGAESKSGLFSADEAIIACVLGMIFIYLYQPAEAAVATTKNYRLGLRCKTVGKLHCDHLNKSCNWYEQLLVTTCK